MIQRQGAEAQMKNKVLTVYSNGLAEESVLHNPACTTQGKTL